MEGRKVALVLSGGGAQGGWVHLGAVQVLEKEKVPFDIIVGTSVGGIIGWGLASGFSVKKLIEKADIITQKDVKKISGDIYAIFDPSAAFEKMKKIYGDKNIEDLPKKFAVTAVDLLTGEEIVLDKGRAVDAIKATTSIPGIFPPVEINGRLLVDGGVLNVLPVDVAYKMGATITIAIDVSSFGRSRYNLREKKGLHPLTKRLIKTTRNAYLSALVKRSYLFESMFESVRIMGNRLRNEKLARNPPTALIEGYFRSADITSLTVDDKKERERLVEVGKQAALNQTDKIKDALALTESTVP